MRGRLHWWLAAVVAVLIVVFWYQSRPRPEAADPAHTRTSAERDAPALRDSPPSAALPVAPAAVSAPLPADATAPPAGLGDATTQSWARWMGEFARLRPGESLLDYRDRVLPVAQTLIEPQRVRVRGIYERAVRDAALSEADRVALDGVIDRSQERIKERVLSGVLSGELLRADVKPMDGVVFARDLLDIVVGADEEIRAILSEDELATFAANHFDLADQLLFSTRWEDLLGVVDDPAL